MKCSVRVCLPSLGSGSLRGRTVAAMRGDGTRSYPPFGTRTDPLNRRWFGGYLRYRWTHWECPLDDTNRITWPARIWQIHPRIVCGPADLHPLAGGSGERKPSLTTLGEVPASLAEAPPSLRPARPPMEPHPVKPANPTCAFHFLSTRLTGRNASLASGPCGLGGSHHQVSMTLACPSI